MRAIPDRRLIALAAAVALAWAPSAVATPSAVDARPPVAAPEQIQMRVTTYAQVIATLGEPDSETARTGGYRSIRYGVTPAHERLLTYVPFVQFFVQRCKGCSTAVVLTFNPAGVRGLLLDAEEWCRRLHSLRLRRSRESKLRLAREACPPSGNSLMTAHMGISGSRGQVSGSWAVLLRLVRIQGLSPSR